ncbi:alpha/beta hydrolase [Novosphingobium sp. MW5]|nr:alpha/beta hydrolase [Novosphingobium sp. MW5]
MHIIETGDAHLYSKAWGEGPPVVLIHGWPLSADSWDPISHGLADAGFKAISYDRRGFGRSSQPSGGYDYDTFADDLSAVMKFHDAQDDVTLVGFSMGGGEIARYMSRHQGKGVSRIALVSSVVPYMLQDESNPDGVPQETFDEMTQGMLEDRAKFFTSFFKDFYGVGWVSKPVSDEVLHLSWLTAMQAGLRPTHAAAKAFATTDFRPDLAHFKVPTLIIHGTDDKTVPIDPTAREVAKKVPGSRLIEYDGSAHGVFATDTERLKNDLLSFIAGDAAPVPQEALDEMTRQSFAADPM